MKTLLGLILVFTASVYAAQVTEKFIANSAVNLTTKVTGVLPIANGGTNSSTSLNNNRIMRSSGGAVGEAAAITGTRVLASDSNGIPTHTSVPTTNLPKSIAANITYSGGTPTVTNEYGGDWINTITDGGVGLPQLNIQGFTTAPVCTCTCKESAVSGSACMITGITTSAINVRTRDLAGTLQDEHFFIVCNEFF